MSETCSLDDLFPPKRDPVIDGLYVRLGLVDKEILDLHNAVSAEGIKAEVERQLGGIFDRVQELLADTVTMLDLQVRCGEEGRFPTREEYNAEIRKLRASRPKSIDG